MKTLGYTVEEWAELKGVAVDTVRLALEEGRLTLALDGSISANQSRSIGVTEAEFARLRDVSREAVNRAKERGWLVLEADGSLNAQASMERWNSFARARTEGTTKIPSTIAQGSTNTHSRGESSAPEAIGDSSAIRDRYNAANAILAENKARRERMKADEEEGKLIRSEDVRGTIFLALRAMRDSLLSIPDRTAGKISGMLGISDTRLMRELLSESVESALEDATKALSTIGEKESHE